MTAMTRTALAGLLGVVVLGSVSSAARGAVSEEAASAQQIFDEFVVGTLTNCFFKYGPTGADPLNNRAFPDAGGASSQRPKTAFPWWSACVQRRLWRHSLVTSIAVCSTHSLDRVYGVLRERSWVQAARAQRKPER